jgi:hypothetical protein
MRPVIGASLSMTPDAPANQLFNGAAIGNL